ncbi:cytochrome C biogenesis protein [Arcobacter cryaerophilus gv. occultus]|uniref:cytochrome c biogenesis CcdA family protein n=1 Tax=Aliarcobacter cryaerophilus TaxID=28198 RepID=UPI000D018F02|nr:cytochrome c biogenesis protein CcdA [Aliarcobacter cryaerophilus]PRM92257.1 cytochrome C biogenesis protein [Arcobacter cryaerophilus gv. occultus]
MEDYVLELLNSSNFIWLFLGALGAGALTSLAPCSLLSVPLLVGSAVGISKDLPKEKKVKFTLIFSSLFAFGVVVSFSILAFLVAKLGMFLSIAPSWAYIIAGLLALFFAFYSLGFIGEIDKNRLFSRLIKLRFFGIFLVGVIFGLVSTPCASAPLVAIISLASSLGNFEAYILVLVFAFGHSLLLLIAGVSVGFTQKVTSNKIISTFSSLLTKFFAFVLIAVAIYLFYKGWLGL